MFSDSTKSLLKGSKLSVMSSDDAVTDALFEVKRRDGQTVFAVYPNAINIYVPRTTPKGVKGGFAIGEFGTAKGAPTFYLYEHDSKKLFYWGSCREDSDIRQI
jgi:hypothetical protein